MIDSGRRQIALFACTHVFHLQSRRLGAGIQMIDALAIAFIVVRYLCAESKSDDARALLFMCARRMQCRWFLCALYYDMMRIAKPIRARAPRRKRSHCTEYVTKAPVFASLLQFCHLLYASHWIFLPSTGSLSSDEDILMPLTVTP